MQTKTLYFLMLCTCFLASAQNPWQEQKGELLLVPSLNHYLSNTYSDSNRIKSRFDNNGLYQNYTPKLYFSYGVKDYKTNIFGNIPFVISQYADDFSTQKNNDFGDVELGIRRHLLKTKNDYYLMGSLSMYIPAYNNDNQPYVGYDKFGLEAKVYWAGNFKWLDVNKNFHKVELSVRYFFPSNPIQFKLYASQGYRFAKKMVVLGEIEFFISESSEAIFTNENIQLNSNFGIIKPTLNLGYEFNPKCSVYVGYFKDIWNQNTSVGYGFQTFAVFRL